MDLPERPGARVVAYRFASLEYAATERRFNSYYADFLPLAPEKLRAHEHAFDWAGSIVTGARSSPAGRRRLRAVRLVRPDRGIVSNLEAGD